MPEQHHQQDGSEQPEARLPRVPLSPAAAEDIGAFYCKTFSANIQDLLHSAYYRALLPGSDSARFAADKSNLDLRPRFEAFAAALEQHVQDSHAVQKLIAEAADDRAKARIHEERIVPLLGQLEETVHQSHALQIELIERYEKASGEKAGCDRPNLSNGIKHFQSGLAQLAHFSGGEIQMVDFNSAAHSVRGFVEEVKYARREPAASFVPEDVSFVLKRFFDLYRSHLNDCIRECFAEYAKDNRFMKELDINFANSDARYLIDAVFLEPHRGTLNVNDEGFQFESVIDQSLRPYLRARLPVIELALEPARALIAPFGASLTLTLNEENGEFHLRFDCPHAVRTKAGKVDELRDEVDAEAENFHPFSVAMRHAWFFQEVILGDGTRVNREVCVDGAAFDSQKSWNNVAAALRGSEDFTKARKELLGVEFHCTGTDESFIEAYRSGACQVNIKPHANYSPFSPENERPHRGFDFKAPFSWQKAKGNPLDEEPDFDDIETHYFGVQTDMHGISSRPLLAPTLRIVELARPLQLSIHHDQEERYNGSNGARPMAGEMLRDLERVLSQLKEKYPAEDLGVQIMNVISMHVCDAGQGSEIYSLEVVGSDGTPIASGGFSREKKQFTWKERNPRLERAATERIEKCLRELKAEDCDADEIQERLMAAGVRVPLQLISALSDALNRVSHDRYFGPSKPQAVIKGFFRNTDYEFEEGDGDALRIKRRKMQETSANSGEGS